MGIYYVGVFPYSDDLYHHGVRGQRWGVRNYVDEQGRLTAKGKAHYNELRGTGSGISITSQRTNQGNVWAGYQTAKLRSGSSTASSGKQFASATLSVTKIGNKSPGSQASTVESGKNETKKMFGSFTVMKDVEGLSTSAIREALEKKRAGESKKNDTSTAATQTDATDTVTTDKSKKDTAKKKTTTAKKTAAKKKSSSKKAAKKKTSSGKSSSSSTKSTVRRTGSTTRVTDLKTAGTSASRKAVEDYLKSYRIKTR